MHHLYPVSKGDQLCPLGFHPQVRWPTRCKRCFRDYKDHGAKRGNEIAASTPSLSETVRARAQSEKPSGRNWTSTSNLSAGQNEKEIPVRPKRPSSWTSTPELDESQNTIVVSKSGGGGDGADVEINIPLPRRRHTTTFDIPQVEESYTLRRPPLPPNQTKEPQEDFTILRTDTLSERVRKMQMLKKQNSLDRELRSRNSTSIEKETSPSPSPSSKIRSTETEPKRSASANRDLLSSPKTRSTQPIRTADETVEKLNSELAQSRNKADDKNEVLLRRLAFTDKSSNKSGSADAAKLQFKVNELSRQLEDLKYEKLHLTTKIKDLEKNLSIKSSKSAEDELKKKLQAAEQLCEELMDENAEVKKEMRSMEEEIDEMQDNFREDRANEYTTAKKELEVTMKNCRILSFKLKKSERKIEQLELEKQQNASAALISQIKKLEEELRLSNERSQQLQIEAEKAQHGNGTATKIPSLSLIGKSNSMDGKYSRAALTRGGSQEDPVQLMRDLQDSIEREADVREQLKFAEEEAESLRKKVLRIEDENESLIVQLKKMASKARSRKLSPTAPSRLTVDSSLDKDEGISDEEDPAELRVLLDLNEQESSQLRRKVDDLEKENKTIKTQLKESRDVPKTPTFGARREAMAKDKEIADLQKKFVDAEKEIAKLKKAGTKTSALKWEEEKKKLLQEAKDCADQLEAFKTEIKNLKVVITKQEAKVIELEKQNAEMESAKKRAAAELKSLVDRCAKQEQTAKQIEASRALQESQAKQDKERLVKLEKELDAERKEKTRWESKVSDLDSDLTALRKKFLIEKATLEKEIAALKLQKDSTPNRKLEELKRQNVDLVAQIELDAKKLTEVTSKYEQLEEQHIFVRAQLTSDKEALQATNASTKSKMTAMESELERFKRDNIDLSRKIVELQNKCKELESKQSQSSVIEHERKRLLNQLQEKSQQYELLASENAMNKDLSLQSKKENDELRRKLGDFEKVNKVQTSLNDHSTALEQEIKQLRAKLESAAMVAKSDIAATRLRYEQQVYSLQTELNSLQKQCERFKRDRDSFKQLLEGAKKTIKELRSNSGRVSKGSMNSGDEDDKSKILILEQKLGTLEDELCEARLEASKLKTELVSERTVSGIKISEMQSRINEHEEERLLGSGRTKMPGMKTKLELSWQKEREDHQRLLQETSTLARDLRQTLFEVERERDKERLENRRRFEQLERNNEEDLDEGRKKVAELQCDLLELRDAHAKLRTSNEKLRLERERYERERDNFYRRGIELNLDRRLNTLLQMVDEVVKVSPDIVQNSILKKPPATPSSQKRLLKSNSIDRRDNSSPAKDVDQIAGILSRLVTASDDIRQFQKTFGDERERERLRRSHMRRAMSSENGNSDSERPPSAHRSSKTSASNGNLYRKSLSFDQSISGNPKIWKNQNDSTSSIQSIDSEQYGGGASGSRNYNIDSSMDSRLSGGSTQSDLPRGTRKKKRGLMGKLKNLTRSSKASDNDGSQIDSGSDISLPNYDHKSSKSNLKDRISDMFKRPTSISRNDSDDGNIESDQRNSFSNRNTPVLPQRHASPVPPRPVQSSTSKVRLAEATNSLKTPTLVKRNK